MLCAYSAFRPLLLSKHGNQYHIFTTTHDINNMWYTIRLFSFFFRPQDANRLVFFCKNPNINRMFWSPWRNVWFIQHIRSGAHVPHPSERSPFWASQQRSQVIHVGHTSNSAGPSLNISSRFNACEILYWHGCYTVIYARRQFCKYLGIFAFIIRDIHFLVPFFVHLFFSGQSSAVLFWCRSLSVQLRG